MHLFILLSICLSFHLCVTYPLCIPSLCLIYAINVSYSTVEDKQCTTHNLVPMVYRQTSTVSYSKTTLNAYTLFVLHITTGCVAYPVDLYTPLPKKIPPFPPAVFKVGKNSGGTLFIPFLTVEM